MAIPDLAEFLKIVPAVRRAPQSYLWSSYDSEAVVLSHCPPFTVLPFALVPPLLLFGFGDANVSACIQQK